MMAAMAMALESFRGEVVLKDVILEATILEATIGVIVLAYRLNPARRRGSYPRYAIIILATVLPQPGKIVIYG